MRLRSRRAYLVWAVSMLLSACAEEDDDDVSPTPTAPPDGVLARQTFATAYHRESAAVQADTSIYISFEAHQGDWLYAGIWHRYGYLILDGVEVPPNMVLPLEGTYGPGSAVLLEGDFFGHSPTLSGEMQYDGLYLYLPLDIDDGWFTDIWGMVEKDFIDTTL